MCALAVLIASCNLDVLVPSPSPRKGCCGSARDRTAVSGHIPAFAHQRAFLQAGVSALVRDERPHSRDLYRDGISLCLLLAEASYQLVKCRSDSRDEDRPQLECRPPGRFRRTEPSGPSELTGGPHPSNSALLPRADKDWEQSPSLICGRSVTGYNSRQILRIPPTSGFSPGRSRKSAT